MHRRIARSTAALVAVFALALGSSAAAAGAAPGGGSDGGGGSPTDRKTGSLGERVPSDVLAYWTPERIAAATPRELLIDDQGLGYLRRADGQLERYGSGVAPGAAVGPAPSPSVKPDGVGNGGGGGGDDDGGTDDGGDGGVEAGPVFGERVPGEGASLTSTTPEFRAVVTAPDGIRSVSFQLTGPSGSTYDFAAAEAEDGRYVVTFSNIAEGSWSWTVTARDGSKGRGITATSEPLRFTVDLPDAPDVGDGGGDGDVQAVANERWMSDDVVAKATGRILFAMPGRGNKLTNYVCSGAVVDDGDTTGSRVLTAAHCVYDDVNKVFAANVLFIPDQDGTDEGARTDSDCSNDPYGCWVPSHGVVDAAWTTTTWPDNIPFDYGFYVVPDASESRQGADDLGGESDVLDVVVGTLALGFDAPVPASSTHAFGYSYSDDPYLMHCVDALADGPSGNGGWFLDGCGLSGGASGGPWVASDGVGAGGPVVSVNSYGYSTRPGMGGPSFIGSSAECVWGVALGGGIDDVVATCPG